MSDLQRRRDDAAMHLGRARQRLERAPDCPSAIDAEREALIVYQQAEITLCVAQLSAMRRRLADRDGVPGEDARR